MAFYILDHHVRLSQMVDRLDWKHRHRISSDDVQTDDSRTFADLLDYLTDLAVVESRKKLCTGLVIVRIWQENV